MFIYFPKKRPREEEVSYSMQSDVVMQREEWDPGPPPNPFEVNVFFFFAKLNWIMRYLAFLFAQFPSAFMEADENEGWDPGPPPPAIPQLNVRSCTVFQIPIIIFMLFRCRWRKPLSYTLTARLVKLQLQEASGWPYTIFKSRSWPGAAIFILAVVAGKFNDSNASQLAKQSDISKYSEIVSSASMSCPNLLLRLLKCATCLFPSSKSSCVTVSKSVLQWFPILLQRTSALRMRSR